MTTAASRTAGSPLGGRFVVEREVGRGGVGIVYRAFDQTTAQHVALKVIAAHGVDAAEEERFAREGRVLSELSHPHIVRVVAFGALDDGAPYVAMEWLDGEDLSARTRRQPLSMRDAIEVARQLAVALTAAHEMGIVHRDIKPSNVFLLASSSASPPPGAPVPFVKLVDFGVAAEDDVRLTRTGAVVGTPAYMAPEQARGDGVADARADLYSLGATLFELVAGRPPHVGPTAIATLARLVTTQAPRLSELTPAVPAALDELVTRLLATDPTERPGSAAEVALALARVLETAEPELARVPAGPGSESGAPGTRLVTSIVAVRVGAGETRAHALEHLAARGADAVPLGQDSLVAHLGARRALGDEAGRALELGKRLAAAGARVGVATGRTRVNLTRPVGEVVDRAAALAHAAEGGEVLADTTTSELARGRFEFLPRDDGGALVGEPLGPKRLEAGGAPFVGREAELAQALGAYERCVEDRTPILASFTGPPGIGKSRLGRELLARIRARPDPPKLVLVRCEPFGRGHALGVAADVVRALVGVTKGSSLETATEALEASHAAPDDAGAGPASTDRRRADASGRELLARLVANEPLPDGMEPRAARDVLWLAMTELVVHLSAREPIVVVLEDMQWADPESVGWVDHALGRAAGRPLYILGLVRPQFWREQGARFSGRDHVKVDLRPISRKAARAIARAMLGEAAGEALLERIAAQAAGSPLFAEELARLTAQGRDAEQAATIEAAIQVSLDALDDAAQGASARLSVFGLSAWDAGLEALGVAPAAPLRQLLAAELVLEQPASRFAGAREVTFKHALVRDVAYASLGADEKRRLHATAARWLAGMGEDAATVAHHFELGGLDAEAAVRWERAARRALAANALTDAVKMAESALAFADERPTAFARALLLDEAWSRLDARAADRETAVRALEEARFDEASELRARGARARYDDARGVGERIAERLAEVLADTARLGLVDEQARAAAALAARHAYGGDLAAAEAVAATLLGLASRVAAAAVDGWQTLAVVRQTRGELASALDARRNAVRAASGAGLKEREAMLTVNVGFALTTIGARQEARHAIESGIALAQAIGSAGTVRHGRMVLLGWAATFGADPSLDAQLAEPRADADAAASGMWMTPDRSTLGVLFYRGCELLQSGGEAALPRARTLLRQSAEAYRATANRDVLPVALGLWAEAERRGGDAARAREVASEAADLLDRGAPSLLNEAPVFLALHDACVDTGDLRGARDALARSVPYLERRLAGLSATSYARSFLTQLAHNAGLLAASEAYGLLPAEIERLLERDSA